jgi:tubulin-specific chaperone B
MSFQAAADVPLLVTSSSTISERRVSPSWSIAQLKARLEHITGIPVQSQRLILRVGTQDGISIYSQDEERTQLSSFNLQPQAELHVSRIRISDSKSNMCAFVIVPYQRRSSSYGFPRSLLL